MSEAGDAMKAEDRQRFEEWRAAREMPDDEKSYNFFRSERELIQKPKKVEIAEVKSINEETTKSVSNFILSKGSNINNVLFPETVYTKRDGTVECEVKPSWYNISEVLSEYLHSVSFNTVLYTFDRTRGIYTNDMGRLDATIDKFCNHFNQQKFISRIQKTAREHMAGMNVYSLYPFNKAQYTVPFEVSTARWTERSWVNGDNKFLDMFTWKLPVRFDLTAPTQPVLDVLSAWVDPDDVPTLVQIPAQALCQMWFEQPYKKEYLLIGDRDSGKSTYLDMLKKFFGVNMISGIPLQNIGARFAAAEMEGVALNVYDDLSSQAMQNLGQFKSFTGTVLHRIERKHQPSYNGYIKCVHVFACNKPPAVDDGQDDAFWSRWEPTAFPNQFKRDPIWFTRKITPEFLSGFANLVLDKCIDIVNNGIRTRNSPAEVREMWLAESLPEFKFVKDMMDRDIGAVTIIKDCYNTYLGWCKRTGIQPTSDTTFGRRMSMMGYGTSKRTFGKVRHNCYNGLKFKDAELNKKPDTDQEQALLGTHE